MSKANLLPHFVAYSVALGLMSTMGCAPSDAAGDANDEAAQEANSVEEKASCGGATPKCASANEGGSVALSCASGTTIQAIDFASYGTPSGSCAAGFSTGSCNAPSSLSAVQAACLGKQNCNVAANNGVFDDPCSGTPKSLAVKYTCGADPSTCGGGGSTGTCATAKEGGNVALSCASGTIQAINFASYGTPSGNCASGFATGSCNASSSLSKVQAACIGKQSCNVAASNGVFSDPCSGTAKSLAVSYTCSVSAGKCATANEGGSVALSCASGTTVQTINFASWGTPSGSCASGFSTGSCNASSSLSTVQAACVGKQSCNVAASNGVFDDPCSGTPKSLAVTYTCGSDGGGGGGGTTTGGGGGGSGKLKVFVLAGESNMVGYGVVDDDHPVYYNGGKGNLEYVMKYSPLRSMYTHLLDAQGKWAVRNDVVVRYVRPDGVVMHGGLTVGYTQQGFETLRFGPELEIGNVLGDVFEEPVLLIKTAWGGSTLCSNSSNTWYPPSSNGPTGDRYNQMLSEVQQALANLRTEFPEQSANGYELSGFFWVQGWNDLATGDDAVAQYETNLSNLIKDIRGTWGNSLKVAIAETGNMGKSGPEVSPSLLALRAAQAAVAKHPEFVGNVAFVPTTDFARPANESPNTEHGYHWYGNAESFFLIGHAMGESMQKLLGR